MIPLVNFAAAAVTAVLTISSGRNMLQTASLVSKPPPTSSAVLLLPLKDATTESVVSHVQSLNRRELLQLYLQSRSPQNLQEVAGEWDGCLLDNHSRVMVRL